MIKSERYCLKDANIVAEVFGDEVVIVNLDSGIYYSLRNSAAQIWLRIMNAYSLEEIMDDFSLLYEGNVNNMPLQIEAFVNQMISHNLIIQTQNNSYQKVDFDKSCTKTFFITPVIEVFSDMQDILLLDPVHDVDKAGWPITKDQKDS